MPQNTTIPSVFKMFTTWNTSNLRFPPWGCSACTCELHEPQETVWSAHSLAHSPQGHQLNQRPARRPGPTRSNSHTCTTSPWNCPAQELTSLPIPFPEQEPPAHHQMRPHEAPETWQPKPASALEAGVQPGGQHTETATVPTLHCPDTNRTSTGWPSTLLNTPCLSSWCLKAQSWGPDLPGLFQP